ncbi:MAG TPA: DUF4843 domain-containing protein [Niastella sp.]
MKRIKYMLVLLATGLSLASCKKEMMGYEGMEGVYFAVRSGPYYAAPSTWPHRPYTNVEFVKYLDNVQELSVNIKVMITGPVKDYDRPFRVEVNPDSTNAQAGVHYLPLTETVIIPANAIEGYIPVTLKRTADMKLENKKIGLRLVANEHFGLAFPDWKAIPDLGLTSRGNDTAWDATLHTINVNDLMVQPVVWPGQLAPGTKRETGSWGAFTPKKIKLMFQLFNLKYEDFSTPETMTPVLSNLIASEMARYLIDQFNAGTPVKEDDGRLMFCGSVPWTSIVGVPY